MADYNAKTDWQLNDTVMPADMNRIEQGILDASSVINELTGDNIVTKLQSSNTAIPITVGGTGATTISDAVKNLKSFTSLGTINSVNDFTTLSNNNSCCFRTADSTWNGALPYNYGNYVKIRSDINGSYDLWIATDINEQCSIFVTNDSTLPTAASDWKQVYTSDTIVPITNGGTGKNSLEDIFTRNVTITTSNDLNDIKNIGIYQFTGIPTNAPTNISNYSLLLVYNIGSTGALIQEVIETNATTNKFGRWYRNEINGIWSPWKEVITDVNLATQVQSLLQEGSVSVVKSIQRGVITPSSTIGANSNISVTISSVNPNKCIVIANGSSTSAGYGRQVYVHSLTATQLILRSAGQVTNTMPISWQVVEYY